MKKFSKNQRIKCVDPFSSDFMLGTVTDFSADTVIIKWDDLSIPSEHEKDEFDSFVPVNELGISNN